MAPDFEFHFETKIALPVFEDAKAFGLGNAVIFIDGGRCGEKGERDVGAGIGGGAKTVADGGGGFGAAEVGCEDAAEDGVERDGIVFLRLVGEGGRDPTGQALGGLADGALDGVAGNFRFLAGPATNQGIDQASACGTGADVEGRDNLPGCDEFGHDYSKPPVLMSSAISNRQVKFLERPVAVSLCQGLCRAGRARCGNGRGGVGS